MGEAPGPGPAGAGALRRDVAQRRRGPGAGALRPRRSATCWPARRPRRASSPRWSAAASPGKGAHVETSLLEALVDFQFEVLTTHLNDGRRLPRRSSFRSAHAYLSAPYGVYPAKDGYPGDRHDADPASSPTCSGSDELAPYRDQPATWFTARDEIKAIIAQRIATRSDRRMARHPRACRHLVRQGARLARADGERRLQGARHAADGRRARTTCRSSPRARRCASTASAPKVERAAPRIGEHERGDPRGVRPVTLTPQGHDLEPSARLRPDGRLQRALGGADRRRDRLGQAIAAGFRVLPGRGAGAALRPDRHRPSACRPDHRGRLPRAARRARPRGGARRARERQRRPILPELSSGRAGNGRCRSMRRAQVQASRPDALERPPARWDDMLALARQGKVLLPLRPPHSLMSFFTLAANLGAPLRDRRARADLIDAEAGMQVFETIREIFALIDAACFGDGPDRRLRTHGRGGQPDRRLRAARSTAMSSYAMAGFRPRRLAFADIPAAGEHGPAGSALGGTGIAVSAFSAQREAAIDFAYWVASGEVQRGPYAAAGGQPGHADGLGGRGGQRRHRRLLPRRRARRSKAPGCARATTATWRSSRPPPPSSSKGSSDDTRRAPSSTSSTGSSN